MTRPRYKVVHVITRLELGGAQQNTLYCAEHHDRAQFEVELIAGAGGVLDDEARGIPDVEVRLVPWLHHAISPRQDLLAIDRLRRRFVEARVDVVHTHSSKAGLLGRIAAALAGVPVVVHTVHGWSFNTTQRAPRRLLYVGLERLAARKTHVLVAVSRRNLEDGLELGIGRPEQYELLRSGIDVESFRAAGVDRDAVRAGLGFGPGHLVVGGVACLKPQKAPLDFVRAAAEAHAREPRLRFFIAGDGELRAEVEAEIARCGLGGIVQLLGWRRDVPQLLAAMDAFLLTSLHEGLPRAVLQAMAAGVPVVATDVDGTPEVVEPGVTGWLVPPARPAAAARAVLAAVSDAALRQRVVDEARRRLTRDYDIAEMVRRLDRLYLRQLERRESRSVRRPRPA